MVRTKFLKSLAPAAVALLTAGGTAVAQDTMQPGGQQQNQPVYQQPGQPGQYQPPAQPRQQGQQGMQQGQRQQQGVPQGQRQQPGMQQSAKQTGAATQDASIQALMQLHAINQVETELALGGINQAQDPDVQRFARMLAKEHQESDIELMQDARKLNIMLAPSTESAQVKAQLEQQNQQMKQQLQQAQGAEFDRQFVRAMVQTHEQALSALTDLSTGVQDKQVSQLLQTRLKVIKKHLDKAQQLEADISGTKAKSGAKGSMQSPQGQQRTTTPGQQTAPQTPQTAPQTPQNAPMPR